MGCAKLIDDNKDAIPVLDDAQDAPTHVIRCCRTLRRTLTLWCPATTETESISTTLA